MSPQTIYEIEKDCEAGLIECDECPLKGMCDEE